MKISLIATLLDEADTLPAMLAGIDAQTRQPDEIVIVDGGSTDASLAILEAWAQARDHVVVEQVRGAGISAGRNAAIRRASGEVIAVTDAGCTLDPGWLAALAAGFDADPDADVVMGFYAAEPTSSFERIMACLNLPDADEIDPATFMPSARSVAFKKTVWERAGGFPEWLAVGEDMYFNFRVRESGAVRRFAPDAIARWRLRPDLRSTLRQYFRYAEGDGRAGMYPERHAIRFATYLGAFSVIAPRRSRRLGMLLVLCGILVRMRHPYRRARRRLSPGELALAVVALPALEVAIDLAKMAGYVSGRLDGNHR